MARFSSPAILSLAITKDFTQSFSPTGVFFLGNFEHHAQKLLGSLRPCQTSPGLFSASGARPTDTVPKGM